MSLPENKVESGQPNPQRLIDMASAYYASCILFTTSDLGVFACLAKRGTADAAQVAADCRLDAQATRLLLDAGVALELLVKDADGYRNTPASALFLVPGSPADMSAAIRYNRDVYPVWGQLTRMLQNGGPVERPQVHLGEDPERTRAFVMAMHGRAMAIGRAIVPMLELNEGDRILDLGGGSGAYAILAAQARPGVRCTVLDLPDVVAIAAEQVQAAGLDDRIDCLAGDYHLADYPAGMDVIHLFGVLHQESPQAISEILMKAYVALKPGGRLHVLDMMTDATRCRPLFSALFAVNMALTAEHGWVFSDADLREWCTAAGFVDFACRPVPPPMPHWLATARKPA